MMRGQPYSLVSSITCRVTKALHTRPVSEQQFLPLVDRSYDSERTCTTDHLAARTKVCLLCFRKGDLPIESGRTLKIIRDYLIDNLDLNDIRVPSSLCSSCRTGLSKIERGQDQTFQHLDILSDYIHSYTDRITRQSTI